MRFGRVSRTLTAWLAVLVLLMVSFAPTISHAVQSARGGEALSWVQICSTTGPSWIKSADGAAIVDPTPAPVVDHLLEHCPFCFLHLDSIRVPEVPADALRVPRVRDAVPAALLHAPHTLHAWTAAQPRAPPAA